MHTRRPQPWQGVHVNLFRSSKNARSLHSLSKASWVQELIGCRLHIILSLV